MMKSPTALISPPSTLTAPKKSVSTEHVPSIHLKQMDTVGYDHEKTKKETRKELRLYEPRSQSALLDKNIKMIPALYIQIRVEFVINSLKKLSNFVPWQRDT